MESADLSDCHYAEACGGLQPQLAPDACVSGTRGGPRTTENNTQRAFNDSILMLCKWLNLSEDTQQRQRRGDDCID